MDRFVAWLLAMTAGAPLVPSIWALLGVARVLPWGERIAVEPFFLFRSQAGLIPCYRELIPCWRELGSLLWSN